MHFAIYILFDSTQLPPLSISSFPSFLLGKHAMEDDPSLFLLIFIACSCNAKFC